MVRMIILVLVGILIATYVPAVPAMLHRFIK